MGEMQQSNSDFKSQTLGSLSLISSLNIKKIFYIHQVEFCCFNTSTSEVHANIKM